MNQNTIRRKKKRTRLFNFGDNINWKQFFFAFFFTIGSIRFFDPAFITSSILDYLYIGMFFLSLIYILAFYKKSFNNKFSIPVFLILVAQLISIFSSSSFWGQSPYEALKATLPAMVYLLFFLLIVNKFTVEETETLIMLLGGVYIFLFLISFVLFPKIIFNFNENLGNDRGFQRIIVSGIGFLFLFSFLAMKRYLSGNKFIWLIIYLVSCVFIIMTLTRTCIIFSFLFSLLYLLRKSSWLTKFLVIVIMGIGFYVVTQMDFYKLMMEETNSQVKDSETNIRMQSADFYLNSFSPNSFTKIFGNGLPFSETSYGSYLNYLEETFGFYPSDIGYIGLYTFFGLLSVLAYIILIYKTIRLSVSNEFLYCKYYMYFIFCISVIIDAPFDPSYISSIVLPLYILSTNYNKPKKLVMKKAKGTQLNYNV